MRHIALVACGTDVNRVPPALHELARRNRVRFAECYVLTTAGSKKQSSAMGATKNQVLCEHRGNAQSFEITIAPRTDSHGKLVFKLIRRLAHQDDTVLYVLLISAPEHVSAIAIGALLLYGRNHDRLCWLSRSAMFSCGISDSALSHLLLTLRRGYRAKLRNGNYSPAAQNGGRLDGLHSGIHCTSRVPNHAVLDWRRCFLHIGGLEIHLCPVECALYWWILQTEEPIPWGKSLRDEDWMRFCTCYAAICRERRNCRASEYSLKTDFDLRLTVLQKAVSTIKRKLTKHLDPSSAEKYIPHAIGKYAEKSLVIAANVQIKE